MAAYEEQDYNKPFSFKTWAKMLPFFKPYTKFFAITIGLNLMCWFLYFRAMPSTILLH